MLVRGLTLLPATAWRELHGNRAGETGGSGVRTRRCRNAGGLGCLHGRCHALGLPAGRREISGYRGSLNPERRRPGRGGLDAWATFAFGEGRTSFARYSSAAMELLGERIGAISAVLSCDRSSGRGAGRGTCARLLVLGIAMPRAGLHRGPWHVFFTFEEPKREQADNRFRGRRLHLAAGRTAGCAMRGAG